MSKLNFIDVTFSGCRRPGAGQAIQFSQNARRVKSAVNSYLSSTSPNLAIRLHDSENTRMRFLSFLIPAAMVIVLSFLIGCDGESAATVINLNVPDDVPAEGLANVDEFREKLTAYKGKRVVLHQEVEVVRPTEKSVKINGPSGYGTGSIIAGGTAYQTTFYAWTDIRASEAEKAKMVTGHIKVNGRVRDIIVKVDEVLPDTVMVYYDLEDAYFAD